MQFLSLNTLPTPIPLSILMVDPIQVPNLALVHVFRDVLEEEYSKSKAELADLDPELQGVYRRRLAALSNFISEALIRSTAQIRSAYKGKSQGFQQVPRLGKETKEPVDQEKLMESRIIQGKLARAIELVRNQVEEETEGLLAGVKAAGNVHLPEESQGKMPNLAVELGAYNRSVEYERDLKAKAVLTLQQVKSGNEAAIAPSTAFEARIYSRFLAS